VSTIEQTETASAGPPVAAVVRVVVTVLVCVLAVWLMYLLRKPLGWLVVAGFIAVAVSGPISLLERNMRRGLAIALVYIGVILMPVLVLAILIPPLVEQGNNLADNAPQYARDLTDTVQNNKQLRKLDEDYDLTAKIQEQAGKLPSKITDVAGGLASVGAGIISSIFAGVTILLLSIFMVGAAPRWREQVLRKQPPERRQALDNLFTRSRQAIGNYVRGALLQALIAGVTSWIVLSILGVPYPLALSLVVFLLDLVPLVGATLGAIIVGLVTVFTDWPTATIVWSIWSVIYQQVENNVIQPRIQSKAVQVEPFIVLVSVLFGSTLFGVIGALLAIPAAATISVAIREYSRYRRIQRGEEPDSDEVEEQKPPQDKPTEPPPAAGDAPSPA
jgi:predicted PurR-regulated permease PerM